MRSDLDALMADRNFDAFIIPGTESPSAHRDYLTGAIHASALVVKKRGSAPVLIVSHMEIEEAAKSGFTVMTYDDFDSGEIYKQHGRTEAASIQLWKNIFEKLDIRGKVTFYGTTHIQYALRTVRLLEKHLGDRIEIVTDELQDIFAIASETKDAQEIEKIRDVGKRTGIAISAVREWISTHREVDGQVVDSKGKPLTVGAVKQYLRLKLLEMDLEEAGPTIFAQGRDAGIPHSRGEEDDILRVGESIVFDLFPRQLGGGYFHDMTRTWCIGHAREDVQQTFNLVKDIFFRSLEGIELNHPTKEIATQVCEWFEAAGHPSRYSTPDTQEGYVHSLGHGLGLEIHEDPSISHLSPEKMIFRAGNVVTIEPGLYYPDKGYGVRIEDTVYLDEKGQIHNLTECPYDLVVPLNG